MKNTTLPFEHSKKPLLDIKTYRRRQLLFLIYGILLILISLTIGVVGYKYFAELDWVSSF